MKITIILISTLCFFLEGMAMPQTTLASDSLKKEKKPPYRKSNLRTHDLLHTRLDVKFNWDKSQMEGKAAITGKPYFKPTSKLDLNARGLEIHSLEVVDLSKKISSSSNDPDMPGVKKLSYSYRYENDSIKINLGREFGADEKYLVRINYTAKPNELKNGGGDAITDDKGLFFINPTGAEKNKMPQIWTQGETQANSAWFPTIDSPNEKMTTEVLMTVDDKYKTLSNGSLTSSKKNSDGTRTDHWKMDLPHSPYLVMMAVGEFVKVTDTPWNGKEISYYVEKEYEPYAKAIFGNTKEMIEFYSKILRTPYPWSKYSQIVVRDYVSGAMENTSATLHGDFMVYQNDREMLDDKKGEAVIAHELFHQWFGDLVTAESWSNLPLNESFATYGEYLWEEHKNGRDAADAHSFNSRSSYFDQSEGKQVEMIRYHYDDSQEMFDVFSYNKGGQILHMLRKYTGDDAFFSSLKLYLDRNRFKNAEIHDLRLAFEEVTGEDLNWFFDQWFLQKGHPELDIEKNYDASSKTLTLRVKQKQDTENFPLYILPVDIDIYAGGKKQRQRIIIDQKQQEFVFPVATQPELVNFDAERQLLAKKTYTRSTEEYLFQYKNAPLFMDRYEALYNLEGKGEEPGVYEAFRHAIEKDKFWQIRAACFSDLKPLVGKHGDEIKALVLNSAEKDNNTNVRATAISFLTENFKDPQLENVYKVAVADRSYAVAAAGLKGLASVNPNEAMLRAKAMEAEKNIKIFYAISSIYGKLGSDENIAYFEAKKGEFSGYTFQPYIYYYKTFLNRCGKPESFERAAATFLDLAKTGNGPVRASAKKAYKESVLDALQQKVDMMKKKNEASENITGFEKLYDKLSAQYKTLSTT